MIAPNRRNETDRITRFQKARFCTLLQGLCGTVLSIIEVFFFLWANIMLRHILEWLLIAAINIFLLSSLPLRSEELQWKIMGHLLEKRFLFQSAVIGDEKILVFGGFSGQLGEQLHRRRGSVLSTCEIVDVKKRQVYKTGSLNVPRAMTAFVQTPDSNIIVVSGLNTDSTTTRLCELYDRKSHTWKKIGSLQIGRHDHIVLLLGSDKILVVGGYAEANYGAITAEAEIFDIRTGQSTFVNNFPCTIVDGIAFQSNIWKPKQQLLMSGRTDGQGTHMLSRIYSFDIISYQWKYEGEMPTAVHAMGIGLFPRSNAMVCVGGRGKLNYAITNSREHFISRDISIETEDGFLSIGKMLIGRYQAKVQPWNEEVCLIIGGGNGYDTFYQTEWFDTRAGLGCVGPALNEARRKMEAYSFYNYDKFGKQSGVRIVVIGGIGANDIDLGSIEILEASNPTFIQTPSEEISVLRWKKIFSSAQFIGILSAFIIALILSLIYLLYQVIQIRRKSRKTSLPLSNGI
ncbi:MAG: hypothetical protein MUF71_09980 [Candidatus Kapabacteria bacterium]|nr:hypothetical protein [Candidatus Kapabacteria bacterium]